jgi:hypothetical protein
MQRIWATLLSAAPGSMLFGLSAAIPAGLEGFEAEAISIVMPGGARSNHARAAMPDAWPVNVRWSTKLGDADVNPIALPPRTRVSRSVVDAATERVSEQRARAIVLSAVQQRLAKPSTLWDALSRRGRCRHRAIIAESIVDAAGGIDSLPEREFARLCERIGLPAPTRQSVLETPSGCFCLDSEWSLWGVRVEVHGLPHRDIPRWDADLLRQNDITLTGGDLLVFSSYAIRHHTDRVAAQLLRAFAQRGWSPVEPQELPRSAVRRKSA